MKYFIVLIFMNVFIFTTKADTNAKGDPIVIIEESISNKNFEPLEQIYSRGGSRRPRGATGRSRRQSIPMPRAPAQAAPPPPAAAAAAPPPPPAGRARPRPAGTAPPPAPGPGAA